jgi:hypothetical protein
MNEEEDEAEAAADRKEAAVAANENMINGWWLLDWMDSVVLLVEYKARKVPVWYDVQSPSERFFMMLFVRRSLVWRQPTSTSPVSFLLVLF